MNTLSNSQPLAAGEVNITANWFVQKCDTTSENSLCSPSIIDSHFAQFKMKKSNLENMETLDDNETNQKDSYSNWTAPLVDWYARPMVMSFVAGP